VFRGSVAITRKSGCIEAISACDRLSIAYFRFNFDTQMSHKGFGKVNTKY
jgi:hypothetical protein